MSWEERDWAKRDLPIPPDDDPDSYRLTMDGDGFKVERQHDFGGPNWVDLVLWILFLLLIGWGL